MLSIYREVLPYWKAYISHYHCYCCWRRCFLSSHPLIRWKPQCTAAAALAWGRWLSVPYWAARRLVLLSVPVVHRPLRTTRLMASFTIGCNITQSQPAGPWGGVSMPTPSVAAVTLALPAFLWWVAAPAPLTGVAGRPPGADPCSAAGSTLVVVAVAFRNTGLYFPDSTEEI